MEAAATRGCVTSNIRSASANPLRPSTLTLHHQFIPAHRLRLWERVFIARSSAAWTDSEKAFAGTRLDHAHGQSRIQQNGHANVHVPEENSSSSSAALHGSTREAGRQLDGYMDDSDGRASPQKQRKKPQEASKKATKLKETSMAGTSEQTAGSFTAPKEKAMSKGCMPLGGITKLIGDAQNVQEVADVMRNYKNKLNIVHISAVLVKLAKLAAQPPRRAARQEGDDWDELDEDEAAAHDADGAGSSSSSSRGYSDSSVTSDETQSGSSRQQGRFSSGEAEGDPEASHGKDTSWHRHRNQQQQQQLSHSSPAILTNSLVTELLKMTQTRILNFDSQGVVNVLHSLAKLRQLDSSNSRRSRHRHRSYFLPPLKEGSLLSTVADDLLYVSTQLLSTFTPQAFSSLAYAVACLDLRPQRQWLSAFFRHSQKLLPSFSPQALANTIWALAKMELHPEHEWERDFYQQCILQAHLFTPQALSNTVWATASLDLHPGPEFKARILAVCTPAKLAQFSAQGLCNLLWGVSILHPDLPAWWIDGFIQVCLPRLSSFSTEQLCTLFYASSLIGCFSTERQGSRWISRLQQLLAASAPAASPQVLANVLYAVGKLQLQPPQREAALLPAVLSASRSQLPAFTPQAVANSAWALARLGSPPDPRWMSALVEEAFIKLALFKPQEMSNLVWALAKLHYTPDPMWMAKFDRESEERMSSYHTQNLSNTAWAFAAFRYKPSHDWCNAFLHQLEVKHQVLSTVQTLEILVSLPELGIRPAPHLLSAMFKRMTSELVSASGKQLAGLLLAAAKLGTQPRPQWVRLVTEEMQPQMLGLDTDTLADAWQSLVVLGHDPGEPWLRSFVAALQASLPSGTVRGASRVIISSARGARDVPGGRPMLDALVGRIMGFGPVPPSFALSVVDGAGSHQHTSSSMHAQGLRMDQSNGSPVGASTAAPSSSSSRGPEGTAHRTSAKPDQGLLGLDARHVLLLLDALIQLEYGSLRELTEMFVEPTRQAQRSAASTRSMGS